MPRISVDDYTNICLGYCDLLLESIGSTISSWEGTVSIHLNCNVTDAKSTNQKCKWSTKEHCYIIVLCICICTSSLYKSGFVYTLLLYPYTSLQLGMLLRLEIDRQSGWERNFTTIKNNIFHVWTLHLYISATPACYIYLLVDTIFQSLCFLSGFPKDTELMVHNWKTRVISWKVLWSLTGNLLNCCGIHTTQMTNGCFICRSHSRICLPLFVTCH